MLGESSTSYSIVSFWFVKFRSGDFSLENEPRGRPQPKVNNDELKPIVENETSQTTRELSSKFDVFTPTILDHFRQINIVKKLNKWILHKLNTYQMKKTIRCLRLFAFADKGEPYLHRIVICDEKWILLNNRERSASW